MRTVLSIQSKAYQPWSLSSQQNAKKGQNFLKYMDYDTVMKYLRTFFTLNKRAKNLGILMSFNAKKAMKGKKCLFKSSSLCDCSTSITKDANWYSFVRLSTIPLSFFRLLKPEIMHQIQNPARIVILDKQFSIAVSRAKIKLTFCMKALYALLWMLNNCLLLIKIKTQKLFPDN